MFRLKACPKCGGDLKIEKDSYGQYKQCVQCGWIRDISDEGAIIEPAPYITEKQPHKKPRKETVSAST